MNTEGGCTRSEAQRLGRMAQCWRADRASSEEAAHAMRRWAERRQGPRRPTLRQALLLVAAGALSTGGALALSGALQLPDPRAAELAPARVEAPASAARAADTPRVYWERGGQRIEPHEESRVELAPGETLTWVVDEARTELKGPGVVELRRSGPEQGWVAAFHPHGAGNGSATAAPPDSKTEAMHDDAKASAKFRPSTTSRAAAGPRPREPQSALGAEPSSAAALDNDDPLVRGAWSRAADALRVGDRPAAAQALGELAARDDPETRDAALLAKAQLDASQGRWSLARPVLETLATSGATPLLRRRAQEVLNQGK